MVEASPRKFQDMPLYIVSAFFFWENRRLCFFTFLPLGFGWVMFLSEEQQGFPPFAVPLQQAG